jgi:DNA-binding beta-propeller fold protein YncE
LSGTTLRVVDLGSDVSVGGLAVDEATGTAAVTEFSGANGSFGRLALVRHGQVHYVTVGGKPGAVSYDSAASTACVANSWGASASLVQNRTAQEISTGLNPTATATDEAAQLCYVVNRGSDTVTEISLAAA